MLKFAMENPWVFLIIGFIPNVLSLFFGFTNWDDPGLVIDNPSIRSLSPKNIVSIFTPRAGKTYQPVRVLSYAIDYATGKLNPFIYHLHNVILYAINVFLVYLILIRLTNFRVAFWAGVCWAFMPVHIESVAWVAARKEVLAGAFFFLSLLLYIDFRQTNRNKALYFLSLLAFILAILSKPTAVVLPLILFIYESLKGKEKRLIYHLPYWLPNILILAYFLLFGGAKKPAYHGGGLVPTIFTDMFIILRYWINAFLPFWLSPRYLIIVKNIFPGWRVVLGLIFVIFLLVVAFTSSRKRQLITFSIAWFFISLLPVLNFVPISTMMADRYIYFASFGQALVFGLVVDSLGKRFRFASYVAGAYLLMLLVVSISMSRIWRNSYTLWSYTLKREPNHPLAYDSLGLWFREQGERIKAYEAFRRAAALDPFYLEAFKNLSAICWEIGRYKEGIEAGRRAVELGREDVDAYYNLANNILSSGNLAEAELIYRKALKLSPNDARIWLNLGILKYNERKLDEAIEYFEHAQTLAPQEPLVYLNLGAVNFELKNYKASKAYYAEFLSRFPYSPDTLTAKGAIAIIDSLIAVEKSAPPALKGKNRAKEQSPHPYNR